MAGLTYDLPNRRIVSVSPGGKTHLLDKSGRVLCGMTVGRTARRSKTYQLTLDPAPSCGWCILISNREP